MLGKKGSLIFFVVVLLSDLFGLNRLFAQWAPTGSMTTARSNPTATLLPNGKVLVAGGCTDIFCHNGMTSAELYDPDTRMWTATGSMTTARTSHTATLLPSGQVLVAGGEGTAGATSSAELYDPDTGAWTRTGSMSTPRSGHMASLITSDPLSGMVLVAGGSSACRGCTPLLSSAELYDPSTGTWSPTGSMTLARYWDLQPAATLPDGSVFVVGGTTCCPYQWFNSAEVYDPVTETWTRTRDKTTRANGPAVLMPDGRVLVAGGVSGTQPTARNVADAELFDPSTGFWTTTASMSIDRASHTLTLLRSGQVLVAGGYSGGWGICDNLPGTELYDSSAGTWSPAVRLAHTATLLPSGQVLVAGGQNCANQILSSAELYIPREAPIPPTP